jgi:hypothetical protein
LVGSFDRDPTGTGSARANEEIETRAECIVKALYSE